MRKRYLNSSVMEYSGCYHSQVLHAIADDLAKNEMHHDPATSMRDDPLGMVATVFGVIFQYDVDAPEEKRVRGIVVFE